MRSYTVCLLLDVKSNRVLLVRKAKTDFAGKYNGVGGEFEAGETKEQCAVREVREETGVNAEGRLIWLATVLHPIDCKHHDPEGCFLHFFAIPVEESEVNVKEGGKESLCWFDINRILNMPTYNDMLAGNGDLQFFLNEAMERLMKVAS